MRLFKHINIKVRNKA